MSLETEVVEVKTLLKDVNSKLVADKQNQAELGARLSATEQLLAKLDSQSGGIPAIIQSAASGILGGKMISANGQEIRVFSKGMPMSRGSFQTDEEEFSLSNFVRAGMGIERPRNAVVSGNGLVPVGVASNIIDAMREKSAIANSGALVIEIDGPTNVGRIDSDPTVYQHTEGAEDVSESVPVLSGVPLNPKSLVALIPLSAEVVADSANLDALLRASISGAFAAKLDALCLATILADANVPVSSVSQDPASWVGVLQAIASGMVFNQGIPTALISNPADMIARASQLASTGGTWLGRPDLLTDLLELSSNGLDAGTAIIANWVQAFAVAVRSQLQLEIVRYAKPGSFSHLLVASMRADGYVMQPNGLFIMDKTVSA